MSIPGFSTQDEVRYYAMLRQIESGGNDRAKAPTSTASGRYQPIKATWEGYGYKWADVFNVEKQEEFIRRFTADNAKALAAGGSKINFATLYAAHFLGTGNALRVLRAAPSASITTVTSLAQRKANPSILKGTVKDFCDWLQKKTGDSVYKTYASPPEAKPKPVPAPQPEKNSSVGALIFIVVCIVLALAIFFFTRK